MRNEIIYPQCQTAIKVTEVMSAQLSSEIRAELEQEVAAKRHEVESKAKELHQIESQLSDQKAGLGRQVDARLKQKRKRVGAIPLCLVALMLTTASATSAQSTTASPVLSIGKVSSTVVRGVPFVAACYEAYQSSKADREHRAAVC